MHLYKSTEGFLIEQNNEFGLINESLDWDLLINDDNLRIVLEEKWKTCNKVPSTHSFLSENLLPPIGNQEVWAAGVTYYSSRLARMEESQDAGGGDFYSRVYQADRPEIFFKAQSIL
jgi:2-dehydro-3-deoxy-D-arabinonate dehydratase